MSTPAARGLVMLAGWVRPLVRDMMRVAARERGVPFSAALDEACRLWVQAAARGAEQKESEEHERG